MQVCPKFEDNLRSCAGGDHQAIFSPPLLQAQKAIVWQQVHLAMRKPISHAGQVCIANLLYSHHVLDHLPILGIVSQTVLQTSQEQRPGSEHGMYLL